jgi:hypothetical protein
MEKKQSKIEKAIWDFYREIYKVATPPADFDKLLEEAPLNENNQKVIDYMSYSVDGDLYDKIVEDTIKKFKLKVREQKQFRFEAYLGAGPKATRNYD